MTVGRRMRAAGVLLGLALLLVAAVPAQADRGGRGAMAVVDAEWACDGTVSVTVQNHAISNIVIAFAGGEVKIEAPFAGVELFEHAFAAADYPGLTAVFVKAGNNGTRGKGERVDLSAPTCGPVDADHDGFTSDVDCDDADDTIYPGAPETVNDGIDQDCDGSDLVVGSGDIRVTLQWESTPPELVDMDLYVVDPSSARVWYANRTVPSGGELDRDDDICGVAADGQSIENVFWPSSSAPSGTYTVGVDEYQQCAGVSGPASWTLEIYLYGILVQTHTGTGDADTARHSAGPGNTFTFVIP